MKQLHHFSQLLLRFGAACFSRKNRAPYQQMQLALSFPRKRC